METHLYVFSLLKYTLNNVEMVHILLPINIIMGNLPSSVEVLGLKLEYSDNPVPVETTLQNSLHSLQSALQFREGTPQDTVDVQIRNRSALFQVLKDAIENNGFQSDLSVQLYFLEHLENTFAGEMAKLIGLDACRSLVGIPRTQEMYTGLIDSLLNAIDSNKELRQYLYEQYFYESPERFSPGPDDEWQPLPFASGDKLSFYITLNFADTYINGTEYTLRDFYENTGVPTPVVRFIVIFNIES
jgi:hypothetical protein